MTRKSVFERYTATQLKEFEKKYLRDLYYNSNKGRCAAGAGIDTLFTVKEWNSKNASALFDDCLAIAMRIECSFFLLPEDK